MIICDLIKGYKLHILTTSNPGYDDPPPFLEGHSCKNHWVSLGRTPFLLHGLTFICSAQSIKNQCLLGVSEANPIKNEKFLAKRQKSAT